MVSQLNTPPIIYSLNDALWQFHNPVKLAFGRGCRVELTESLSNQTLLVVTTSRGRRQFSDDPILGCLTNHNRIFWIDSVRENPGLTDLQAEIDRLKSTHFDATIAFGGGSSIDSAKVLNVALAPSAESCTLEELLLDPSRHANAKVKPLYTVPTTAGTGSEVTPFATVWNHESKRKFSLAGQAVWPYKAYVDPDLTDSVPLEVTITTGLDAINQAAESLWNRNANPITLGYAIRALQLGFSALPKLVDGKEMKSARSEMAEASLLAGLAISNTRTALCHSISYPISAHFGVPHGLACAFTMPVVLRHNLQAEDGRLAQAAHALTCSHDIDLLVKCFDDLHSVLGIRKRVVSQIPSLGALLDLQREMLTPGRADNNLADAVSLENLLTQAWNM
jgi:alcohol dehydrogenase